MKGQTNEIVNLVILIVVITVLFLLSYFITTSPQRSTQSLLEKEYKYNLGKNALYGFYYTKIPGVEVSYATLIGYRKINGNPVYFGEFYPYVDVDEMITEYFTQYFGNNWYFEMKDFNLGNKRPSSGFQSIEVLIPMPSQNNIVERGYLYVWSN
ncbi:MAG: hypothetical protein QXJ06_03505 [Candidatus Aenigmatarchaeota archaeon]